MSVFHIITGDSRTVLKQMRDQSVHCVVTSPPYWGLRDYGVDGQIGLEPDFNTYIRELVDIFREVRRVLRDDGTLWLNLGDSYVASPRGNKPGDFSTSSLTNPKRQDVVQTRVKDAKSKQATNRSADIDAPHRQKEFTGLKSKDLVGIPWRVAFALQADGWYLRQDIIWAKPNPMPESVRDRCTKAHEYLFLLSKNERYYFDADAINEPAAYDPSKTKFPDGWDTGAGGHGAYHRNGREKGRKSGNVSHKGVTEYEASDSEEHRTKAGLLKISETAYPTRNKRSVWTIAPFPFKEAHFATFPPALVEPCIKAGCPSSGVVLDSFAGAGTTSLVAMRLNRNSIGIELNPGYADLARRRIADDAAKRLVVPGGNFVPPVALPSIPEPAQWTSPRSSTS